LYTFLIVFANFNTFSSQKCSQVFRMKFHVKFRQMLYPVFCLPHVIAMEIVENCREFSEIQPQLHSIIYLYFYFSVHLYHDYVLWL